MRLVDRLDSVMQDGRYALRQLIARPAFTIVVTATLAVGLGANTAVFSIVNGVLLRPLPYERPAELVSVWARSLRGAQNIKHRVSLPEILDYREQAAAVSDVAYFLPGTRTYSDGPESDPARIRMAWTSAELFPLLGVRPAAGRWFTPEESAPGVQMVVLSHDFWAARYGADPDVIGRAVSLDDQAATVVGAMPEGFGFPDADTDLWVSSPFDETDPGARGFHRLGGIARLTPGVSLEQAQADLQRISQAWLQLSHHADGLHFLEINPFRTDVVGDVRAALILIMAAVGLVLAITCVNIGNLLLARGHDRQNELLVRRALGASRTRIAGQLLVEGAILATAGSIAGLALAPLLLRTVLSLDIATLPRGGNVAIDVEVLAFTAALTMATTLLFGLGPALRLSFEADPGIASISRATVDGRQLRLRGLIVSTEMALSIVVVVSAGLIGLSYSRLTTVDPGVDVTGTLTFSLSTPRSAYGSVETVALYERYRERLRTLPGVEEVGAVSQLPLTTPGMRNDLLIEDLPEPADDETPWNAEATIITPGYLDAVGLEVEAGRTITAQDSSESPLVVLVNRTFARTFFPSEDPVGRRVAYQPWEDPPPWATIVGVVEDARTERLDVAPFPQVYVPHAQSEREIGAVWRRMTMAVRTAVRPESLVTPARQALAELAPQVPLFEVRTVEEVVAASVAVERLTMKTLVGFGLMALLLSAAGVYAVVAHSVSRRTREVGIRMALGAGRSSVVLLMVRQSVRSSVAGALVGVVASALLAGALRDLLFEVGPREPAVLAAAPVVMLTVSLLAAYVPAQRAARVSPTHALKGD